MINISQGLDTIFGEIDKVRKLQRVQLVSIATTCFVLSLLTRRNRKTSKIPYMHKSKRKSDTNSYLKRCICIPLQTPPTMRRESSPVMMTLGQLFWPTSKH